MTRGYKTFKFRNKVSGELEHFLTLITESKDYAMRFATKYRLIDPNIYEAVEVFD